MITAAAESEGVKVNKKLIDNHFLFDFQTPICSCDDHAHRSAHTDRMGARRELNFYGSQINRISDAISVKRGELLRIKDFTHKYCVGHFEIKTPKHKVLSDKHSTNLFAERGALCIYTKTDSFQNEY